MKKRILSKLFIFLMTVATVTGSSYGYSEAEQSMQTTVQPSVAIEKTSASIETGSVNAQTGVHTGLQSVFSVKTNGTDDDYDFIISSKINSADGDVSAYGNNGQILFAHTLVLPTNSAIEDAKMGGNNNKNVIAYPVTATITEPMTVDFNSNYGVYGDCYVVKVNSAQDGTMTHTVNTTPVSGSYSIGQDQAGTYQSVVTFTAVSK